MGLYVLIARVFLPVRIGEKLRLLHRTMPSSAS
jgi:hypothetical protein